MVCGGLAVVRFEDIFIKKTKFFYLLKKIIIKRIKHTVNLNVIIRKKVLNSFRFVWNPKRVVQYLLVIFCVPFCTGIKKKNWECIRMRIYYTLYMYIIIHYIYYTHAYAFACSFIELPLITWGKTMTIRACTPLSIVR